MIVEVAIESSEVNFPFIISLTSGNPGSLYEILYMFTQNPVPLCLMGLSPNMHRTIHISFELENELEIFDVYKVCLFTNAQAELTY